MDVSIKAVTEGFDKAAADLKALSSGSQQLSEDQRRLNEGYARWKANADEQVKSTQALKQHTAELVKKFQDQQAVQELLNSSAAKLISDATGLGGVRRVLKETAATADDANVSVSWLTLGLGTGLVVAAGAVAAKLWEAVSSTTALGDKLNAMSQTTGLSVEKLSAMRLTAETSNTSLEAFSTGISQFNKHIDQAAKGTGTSADAFKRLGISLRDEQGNIKSTNVLFGEFADKMSSFEDGSAKTAIAMELMGRSGKDLIPLLNEGSAGFSKLEAEAKRAGITMSAETAKAANELNANLAVLKAYGQGFWAEIASPIVESLAKITQAMRDARNEGQGFIASMWAGVARAGADVFGGTAKGNLADNQAREQRLISSIRRVEGQQGAGANVSGQLKQLYTELQSVYAERTGLEGMVAVEDPNLFGGKGSVTPPDRTGRPKKTKPDDAAAKALLALEAEDARVMAEASRWTQKYYADLEKAAEKASKVEIKLSEDAFKAEQALDKEDERTMREVNQLMERYAQDELDAIKKRTYLTRDARLEDLQGLREKYREWEGAEKRIAKTIRDTESDAEAFSKKLAEMFAFSVPDAILKTVGVIRDNLSTAIYDFITGAKSLGDALKSFFASVAQSIIKMFADIAARNILSSIFSGTPLAATLGLTGVSGAASAATAAGGGSSIWSGVTSLFSGGSGAAATLGTDVAAYSASGALASGGASSFAVPALGMAAGVLMAPFIMDKIFGYKEDPAYIAAIRARIESDPAFAAEWAEMGRVLSSEQSAYSGGMASGTDTLVSRPTLFMAGEAGTERVTVSPISGAARNGGLAGHVGITINGPAMFDEYTFRRFKRMMAG